MNIFDKEEIMAKIIENKIGRRSVRLSTDDIISVVREYQNFSCLVKNLFL